MEIFIGRQPIFNIKNKVQAYELLYRNDSRNNSANISNQSEATKILVADALNVFDISKLTSGREAFINFGEELLLNGFVKVLNPADVTIELLEFIEYTDELVDCIRELRMLGYTFAVDDFDGTKDISKILPYISTIKVDFMICDHETQRRIAERYKDSGKKLLAEKVETVEDFERAKACGYELFQGYYFAKPTIVSEKYIDASFHNYLKIIKHIFKKNFNFRELAKIIRTDVLLSYHLMKKMNTVQYFRGVPIKDLEVALVRMGEDNFRRWISLMMVRGLNSKSDELVKIAYMRGRFIEELMRRSDDNMIREKAGNGFLVGMFSLMPAITDVSIDKLLEDISIADDAKEALLGEADENNELAKYLKVVVSFENPDDEKGIELKHSLKLDEEELAEIYIKCIEEADEVFDNEEGVDAEYVERYGYLK